MLPKKISLLSTESGDTWHASAVPVDASVRLNGPFSITAAMRVRSSRKSPLAVTSMWSVTVSIPPVRATPHTFRHQAITGLTRHSGMADAELQLITGHDHPSSGVPEASAKPARVSGRNSAKGSGEMSPAVQTAPATLIFFVTGLPPPMV